MERRHDDADFLREAVRLIEAHMDDMSSACATAENKAKVMAGFCIAALVYLFGESVVQTAATCALSWVSAGAVLCFVAAVVFCCLVWRASDFYPKGLLPSHIRMSRDSFGDNLTAMLQVLTVEYDRRVNANIAILKRKERNLERAQYALWPGLFLLFAAVALKTAMKNAAWLSACSL